MTETEVLLPLGVSQTWAKRDMMYEKQGLVKRGNVCHVRQRDGETNFQSTYITSVHVYYTSISGISFVLPGWFEVLPENGQPVEYFDTISAIVALRPKQFLVRTSTVGYELNVENGISSWVPHEIRPGEILTTGIIHMDQKKSKKKTLFKRLFSPSGRSKKDQELKYLQCFDSKNCEIMVPLIMTGVFSPVGDQLNPNYDAVYSLHDLLSAFNLPIKAQLVHADAQNTTGIPSGVLLLESLKDNETVLASTHPYVEGETPTFEIALGEEIHVVKEKKKRSKKPSLVSSEDPYSGSNGGVFENGHVDLPIRVKETKKSKGSAILEKLSVRSKSRKERASLKALQEQGIFSSRLSKSELNFEDFYNVDKDENSDENNDTSVHNTQESVQLADKSDVMKTKTELDIENGYSVSSKRTPLRERDLPPIPNKTRSPIRKDNYDKENDYEELPLAPKPPKFYSEGDEEHPDDGYMTPARFRELNGGTSRGNGDYDNIVKRKPPTAPKDYARLKYARARKARSEYATGAQSLDHDTVDNNIDKYFEYALGKNETPESPYDRRRPARTNYHQSVLPSPSQEYDRRFHDDSVIEARSLSGFAKLKSRSQKNLAMESNATIRSHNVRKMRTAMDMFSDSQRDIRQPVSPGNGEVPNEPMYGRVVDDERIKSYVYGQQNPYGRLGTPAYVESEPGYRKYHRSSSNAGLSDSFPKYGDDSAISVNSRGEYGTLHGESEYSYSEYSEWHDDGWVPPDDISSLSVLEVSKSLRYIGMKDRVVIRFAREQIDGSMLQTLDIKLLKEGFPELNALDIKKILDFVDGWRPKK